ncbi:MAG: hypothetical protein WCA36_01735 [Pseudolabrys sp.]
MTINLASRDLVSSRHTIPADRRSPADDVIPDWSEQLTTAVATALAVLLVAVVAVLMGSV